MAVRDTVLPAINRARGIIATLGFRRTTVTIRVRTWAGTRVGDKNGGTPGYTDVNTVLSPTPKVAMMSPYAMQMAGILTADGNIEDRYLKVSSITPQFVDPADGLTKGYTPAQLKQLVSPGVINAESIIVLVGDDGVERQCQLVITDFTKPFGYEMIVRLRARQS